MSYAACHHDIEAPIAADNNGVFFLNSHVSLADITDGPAYTIFAGEFIGRSPLLGWAVGTRASLRNTGWRINTLDPYPAATAPMTNMTPGFGTSPYGGNLAEVESLIRDGQVPESYVGGFLSHHQGMANFLFGDGSVRGLTERIDPHVFRSLGHRADGNLISGDDF